MIPCRRSPSLPPLVGASQDVEFPPRNEAAAFRIDLVWDSTADLDWHVFEPRSEEIDHGKPRVESGGELDQDANAAVRRRRSAAESVRWPTGFAPSGRYIARVNHWGSCGAAAANFVVQAISKNSRQTVSGMLTGPGTAGGRGAGTTVREFTR